MPPSCVTRPVMIERAKNQDETLRVRPAVLKTIHAHARAAAPSECCGALLGDGVQVVTAVRLSNEAERSGTRYRIGPDQVRELEADADRRGLTVLGFYHSHPVGPAAPSPGDIRAAWPWYSYLIKGVDGFRAYRLLEDRTAFAELRITPSPGPDRMAS